MLHNPQTDHSMQNIERAWSMQKTNSWDVFFQFCSSFFFLFSLKLIQTLSPRIQKRTRKSTIRNITMQTLEFQTGWYICSCCSIIAEKRLDAINSSVQEWENKTACTRTAEPTTQQRLYTQTSRVWGYMCSRLGNNKVLTSVLPIWSFVPGRSP